METQIFKRTRGNKKSIEVYDMSGNFYRSFDYIENEKDALIQARNFADLLKDFPEDQRELVYSSHPDQIGQSSGDKP